MQPRQANSSMTVTIGLFTRTFGSVSGDEKGLADTEVVAEMSAIARTGARCLIFMVSLLFKIEERCCSDKETGEDRFYSIGM